MSKYSAEGKVRTYYVPTIANIAAPTVAELNAGTNLTTWTPRDGFNPSINQNMVDISSLADQYDSTTPGSEGGPITLTFFRDDTPANDTAWNLFAAGGLSGYYVVREGPLATVAWTIAQKAQVYPFTAHKPTPLPTTTNEPRKFQVMVGTLVPDRNATVA